jgi:hypothetical protein
MELSQETNGAEPQADAPIPELREELVRTIAEVAAASRIDTQGIESAAADAIMNLLNERGHYLPGCPPAQRILDDAKSFAERLTLSNLACRVLFMLAWSTIETPESRPARKWVEDYLEGRGHGPIGKPMLWPARLPGLAGLLREWGFEPSPSMPPYVARSLPNPTAQ